MEEDSTSKPRRGTRRRFTRLEQAEHVDRWKLSGLSASAYAREHAISYKSLYAWRSRLRLSEADRSDSPQPSPFIPVRVGVVPGTGSNPGLEVIVRANSFECVLSGMANRAELVSLVKSLKQEVFDV